MQKRGGKCKQNDTITMNTDYSLSLHLRPDNLSTLRAIPVSFGYSFNSNTSHVKPDYWALDMVTGNHLSQFWLLTEAPQTF